MISAPGVGSGLDVNSIVDQLMAIERRPLQRLESDRQDLQVQLSAYGTLQSSLASFQSALSDLKTLNAFEVYAADSADEEAFTATANSSAAPGFTDIQVVVTRIGKRLNPSMHRAWSGIARVWATHIRKPFAPNWKTSRRCGISITMSVTTVSISVMIWPP